MQNTESQLPRRVFLWAGLVIPTSLVLSQVFGEGVPTVSLERPATAQELPLTPACDDSVQLTLAQTEGPYFKPSSPRRASLLEGEETGTTLVLSGFVLSRECRPIPHALLDFWQADASGAYDNRGYRFRGHQLSDENGRFWLETVMPGLYPGRTRHIHVKVQAPNGPILTTQLYFPNEPRNRSDGLFNRTLVVDLAGDTGPTFNFVVGS